MRIEGRDREVFPLTHQSNSRSAELLPELRRAAEILQIGHGRTLSFCGRGCYNIRVLNAFLSCG